MGPQCLVTRETSYTPMVRAGHCWTPLSLAVKLIFLYILPPYWILMSAWKYKLLSKSEVPVSQALAMFQRSAHNAKYFPTFRENPNTLDSSWKHIQNGLWLGYGPLCSLKDSQEPRCWLLNQFQIFESARAAISEPTSSRAGCICSGWAEVDQFLKCSMRFWKLSRSSAAFRAVCPALVPQLLQLALVSSLLALFHCMVRYGSARLGTAQFGLVCISTAV